MVSKAEYLDMMQGIPETSGYLTSPMFQEGFEDWNPDDWKNKKAEDFREAVGSRGLNFLGGVATESYAPGEYPYPDYDPARWGTEFGHEITHSSIPFQGLKEFFSKYFNRKDLQSGKEEALARLHDYMYGDITPTGMSYFPLDRGYVNYNYPGNFSKKAYDLIRNSKLKNWQKGVMSLGPTSSRGQIALGQTPNQVQAQGEAYMSPDRGNVQAPTMSQQEMVQEATQTGGTVNPHEVTKATWEPQPWAQGPHDYNKGGLASL